MDLPDPASRHPLRAVPRAGAIAILLALIAILAWSSIAVPRLAAETASSEAHETAGEGGSTGDFALYTHIHQRVATGESYYAAALAEQRAGNYPTRPFVTVRLPTLAWLNAALGPPVVRGALLTLLLATAAALYMRTRVVLGVPQAAAGAFLLLLGGAGVMADQASVIHELVAGLLLSLTLVLHRSERWWPSLALAALALAVRELALPFVLLWLAFALGQRRWREAAAVGAVLALFAAGLWAHYLAVTALLLPIDQTSPGWQAFAGPALPLLSLARMSALLVLPLWLAGPLAVLALLGWFGLGGRTGLFAGLWFTGFFLAMALFARPENTYWVMLVLPAYLAGLAWAPRALRDLFRAAATRR